MRLDRDHDAALPGFFANPAILLGKGVVYRLHFFIALRFIGKPFLARRSERQQFVDSDRLGEFQPAYRLLDRWLGDSKSVLTSATGFSP
jgi:hypothetical protein